MHSNFDCICNYIPKDYLKDKLYVITGNVSHINSREDRIMLTYFLTFFLKLFRFYYNYFNQTISLNKFKSKISEQDGGRNALFSAHFSRVIFRLNLPQT